MSPLPEICFAIPRNPILAVGLPVALGMASGYASATSERGPKSVWYKTLVSPPGTPPNQVFAPVWTALYAGMGYASHLTVRAFDSALTPAATAKADSALQLYYAQLALNLLWSPLFFGAQKQTLALGNILALTGTVAKMAVDMNDVSNYMPGNLSTNWFIVPYLGWLAYATYLNAGYVFLNWDKPGSGKRAL